MMGNKYEYIKEISRMGDRYGNLLLKLMEEYRANSLQQITEEQAKEFFKKQKGSAENVL